MTTDTQPSPPFTHEKNITVGRARVIYGPYGFGGQQVWHLPGGSVTVDQHEAHAYAVRMNQIMDGK